MHTFYPKLITTLFFLFLFAVFSYATIYPISIDQRIEKSKQVAIGEVVQQYSFWDEQKQNIYTAHLLDILKFGQ